MSCKVGGKGKLGKGFFLNGDQVLLDFVRKSSLLISIGVWE
jgi:hypothetical protein